MINKKTMPIAEVVISWIISVVIILIIVNNKKLGYLKSAAIGSIIGLICVCISMSVGAVIRKYIKKN